MAKFITREPGTDPSAQLKELRRILADRGKKLRMSRVRIINGYVRYRGTIDNVSFYWLGDLAVVRAKSSLDGKRFKKEKCFEGSRQSAQRFADGNRLASHVYARVPEQKRAYSLFCFLKKKAILLIKEGRSRKEAEIWLMDYLKDLQLLPKPEKLPKQITSREQYYGNRTRVVRNAKGQCLQLPRKNLFRSEISKGQPDQVFEEEGYKFKQRFRPSSANRLILRNQ